MARFMQDSSMGTTCMNCGKAVSPDMLHCDACKNGGNEGVADMRRDAMFGGGENSNKSVFDTVEGFSSANPMGSPMEKAPVYPKGDV